MSSSSWHPTLTFQRFKKKHYELNRLYWTQQLGQMALLDKLRGANDQALTISEVAPDLHSTKHMHTVAETRQWSEEYISRSRLHLLVICSANLESYLQDITFWYVYGLGHVDLKKYDLNIIGKALAQPILGKASLPEPLKYAQELFKLDFGEDLLVWQKAYKLRCAAAHNGGIVTAKTIRDIPSLSQELNTSIGLDWCEFKTALSAAEAIAKKIDKRVSCLSLRIEEVKHELLQLKAIKRLPDKVNLWSYVHENYGLKGLSSTTKKSLEVLLFE